LGASAPNSPIEDPQLPVLGTLSWALSFTTYFHVQTPGLPGLSRFMLRFRQWFSVAVLTFKPNQRCSLQRRTSNISKTVITIAGKQSVASKFSWSPRGTRRRAGGVGSPRPRLHATPTGQPLKHISLENKSPPRKNRLTFKL
jgi:hypothetical protein